MGIAASVSNLTFSYADKTALEGVSFSVRQGEMFGLVGPNGGGKSTTFKILSSLLKPQSGKAEIFGHDLKTDADQVRQLLGVVFQSPALDKKLSVWENLIQQGKLYGMSGQVLNETATALLTRLDILDRKSDRVETLSGGLKRRLEIAKSLVHSPKILILDEPTTGLDPLARREVWNYLKHLKEKEGLTILLTTHLLDEADACETIALLDKGKLIAFGNPQSLRKDVGAEFITLRALNPTSLKGRIESRFHLETKLLEGEIRIQKESAHTFIPELISAFPDEIESVTLGKPTLEDFFISRTGRKFWQLGAET